MKLKNKIITFLCVFLIVAALVGSLFLDNELGSRFATIITLITAIIGAIALFIQFKRDKDLNQATFLIDYSVHFYSTYGCRDILDELETSRKNPEYVIDIKTYYKDIVGYLEWLESLACLVNNGTLPLKKIDDVLSYRFFIIVNNKQIQDYEIIPCRDFYRGIYKLYDKWSKYKRERGLPIIFENTELSNTEGYNELLSKN